MSLSVIIKTALELVTYLTNDVGFKYLLIRRINQDILKVNII